MANKFYFAAPSAEEKTLHLVLAGITDPEDSFLLVRDRTSPLYVFQYIMSGHGVLHEEEFSETDCHAGDFLITHAWKAHSYFPVKKDPWSKAWINVTGTLVEALLQGNGIGSQCVFRNCTDASKLLLRMIPVIPKLPVDKVDEFTESLLLRLIRLLRKQSEQYSSDPGRRKAEKIRSFLLGFLMVPPPSLENICCHAALSPAQTIRVFKKYYAETPYSYLLDAKLHAAANALLQTSASVREISANFGFRNEYYFSRIFRQRIGLAPGTYRNMHRKIPEV